MKGSPVSRGAWPELPASGRAWPREEAAREVAKAPSYIARLVSRLPGGIGSRPEMDDYFALLDRVLEDRRVTPGEVEALRALAEELGISQNRAIAAHHSYMRDLICVALEDGVITQAESADLEEVRRLLGLSEAEYRTLLDETRLEPERGAGTSVRTGKKGEDLRGKSICFTGALACRIGGRFVARSFAEEIALERGMVVKKGVTTTLDYLVAADPDSMSGKAKKAHKYGVRIIAEPVFWRLVGEDIE